MTESVNLITALITPFTQDDQIDYPALDRLTDKLFNEGTQGFVIGGTTGESPTLTEEERFALYDHFAAYVAGRGPVIANVGTNNTAESVAQARRASQIPGVTAVLAVTPYYNKPDQAGMIAHFTAIADASAVPVMLYNIPGRSSVALTNESVLTLADHPNINAVKQVTSIDDLATLVAQAPAGFDVYTGEDSQTLAAKSVGCAGTISVASHLFGNEMQALFAALEAGDVALAGQYQRYLTPRMNVLFSHPSPTPVKAVLAQAGLIENQVRLPLLPLTAAQTAEVQAVLNHEGAVA
ncbi:4-hydroxy-tetrahydrodipicolinate synthase [Fructobacillus ficulneus]|uniref:4-hydroxy-tetrahydrodipicolinate synthase n=1 Tax=Fructobacillus ficulneus TaxID=157463 RepID=A0A0K8MHZ8_9LACO|nr:4-hydroxy-tetrahydrodipicolinate synthase [Fructobacillus ficulneus]GAP00181.1 dihydrodipicolinate synthase [Fructobacillus ficulneus]